MTIGNSENNSRRERTVNTYRKFNDTPITQGTYTLSSGDEITIVPDKKIGGCRVVIREEDGVFGLKAGIVPHAVERQDPEPRIVLLDNNGNAIIMPWEKIVNFKFLGLIDTFRFISRFNQVIGMGTALPSHHTYRPPKVTL